MEVLGNTASGMDNRSNVSCSRGFDFSLFASELFNRVSVQKSYAANQDEGGIAGTVQLFTAKPFDYAGQKIVLSAKAQTNDQTSGVTPRLVGLFSQRRGDFGALVSVAYSKVATMNTAIATGTGARSPTARTTSAQRSTRRRGRCCAAGRSLRLRPNPRRPGTPIASGSASRARCNIIKARTSRSTSTAARRSSGPRRSKAIRSSSPAIPASISAASITASRTRPTSTRRWRM